MPPILVTLLTAVVIALIASLIVWGIRNLDIPAPIKNIFYVAVVVGAGIWIILLLARAAGIHP